VTPLTAEQVGITSTGWHAETPLWYYILREADACTGGHRLGPVGGRIVAEGAGWAHRYGPDVLFVRTARNRPAKKTLSESV